VDMFLFSAAYQDVATLGNHTSLKYMASVDHIFLLACLPHYTSGQTYYYPAFNAGRTEDAVKFAHEFGEVLATPIMLEAVMRVRASRGKNLYVSSLSIADNFNYRSSYGLFPWQFLRSVNGPFGNARCAPGPVLRY
jgi:hypothetical protein